MTEVACKQCNAAVPVGRKVYCSDGCKKAWRLAYRIRRVEASCAHCGVLFMALELRARRGRVYCSKLCVDGSAVATGRFRGENNPRWLGGVSNDNMRYKRRTEAKYPERAKARRIVREAILAGRIKRQPCEVCNAEPAQAHHDDYAKPLAVRWLCRVHHDEHHASERAA